jgi:transposase
MLSMSLPERERAFFVRQVVSGQLTQRVAAERPGIGLRQMKRLIRVWRASGDAGLVSRKRGHRSNRSLPPAFHTTLEEHLRGQYQGFGPTLAAEKLAERDGIKISVETVRRAQIRLGLWRPKKRRLTRTYQLRDRRPRFGELIQIDGSPHDWFEGRAPHCTLIVFLTTRRAA